MKVFNIASIPGDGVGKEVVPAAQRVLKAVSDVHGGLSFRFTEFPYSCEYYLEHGEMMPDDGMEQLKEFDSIFLGAVGNSKLVPDHISLWGLLIKIRREFEQVINVRPAKYLQGIKSPLANPKDFDLLVVRENSEGEYSSIGGRIFRDEDEIAIQNAVFQEKGRRGRCALHLSWRLNGKSMSQAQQNRTESYIQCLFGMKSLRTRQKTTLALPLIRSTLTRCRPFCNEAGEA